MAFFAKSDGTDLQGAYGRSICPAGLFAL